MLSAASAQMYRLGAKHDIHRRLVADLFDDQLPSCLYRAKHTGGLVLPSFDFVISSIRALFDGLQFTHRRNFVCADLSWKIVHIRETLSRSQHSPCLAE